MKFQRGARDEPEINLIPFIDVLLVVLIFLMLSSSLSKFTELQVQLPTTQSEPHRDRSREVIVAINHEGRYSVNRQAVPGARVDTLAQALVQAGQGRADSVLIISADAKAPHQSVMTALEAARHAGLAQITFAAQRGTR